MGENKLKQMEELDARIEKINFDLAGLINRKEEMEQKKFGIQEDIDKLEKNKKEILAKTDEMNRLQKIIYIAFLCKKDLKEIDLLNAKIEESKKEKDNIQGKIDIQNKLYADTVKEKDGYIEQRKKLYVEHTKTQQKQEQRDVTSHAQDLAKIHQIAKKYEGSKIMTQLRLIIEEEVNKFLGNEKPVTKNAETEEQDEME